MTWYMLSVRTCGARKCSPRPEDEMQQLSRHMSALDSDTKSLVDRNEYLVMTSRV
jgi:hypothetical protein